MKDRKFNDFRALRQSDGKLVYGQLIETNEIDDEGNNLFFILQGKIFIDDIFLNVIADLIIQINPKTICQFIGLYDYNKKKIYEYDILKNTITNRLYYVKYINGCFQFISNDLDIDYICADDFSSIYEYWNYGYLKNIVIIGNIFNNPELILNNFPDLRISKEMYEIIDIVNKYKNKSKGEQK